MSLISNTNTDVYKRLHGTESYMLVLFCFSKTRLNCVHVKALQKRGSVRAYNMTICFCFSSGTFLYSRQKQFGQNYVLQYLNLG